MSSQGSEFWARVRQAQSKLVNRFLSHPEVSLIDIGYDLDSKGKDAPNRIVLRVHVRFPSTRERLNLPSEIDDIPVRVVVADYEPD